MSKRWVCGACVVLLALGPTGLSAAEPARKAGVLWEETVEMAPMGGFRMPPQTRQACRPASPEDWSGPPGDPKQQDDCKVTSMQRSGPKMSWKVTCEKQRVTGDGEMAWAGDSSYSGTVNMHSPDGDMSMKLRGKKLGGACDAGAEQKRVEGIKRQMAESQASSAQHMKGMCDGAVQNFDFNILESEFCKGRVKDACARMETIAGYRHLSPLPETYRGRAERACGKQLESLVPQLCAQAARNLRPGDAQTNENLSFITQKCPSEKQALAQRECAGRSYTGSNGPAEWMRSFCFQYAQDLMERRSRPARASEPSESSPPSRKRAKRAESAEAKDDAPEKANDDAVEKAKKAAKGIFGF